MMKSLITGVVFFLLSSPLFAGQWQGVLEWSHRTEMGTTVSGVVSRVAVAPGELVKKGQLLLQLEQGALRARIDHYRAGMKHRKLLREEASRELERAEELYARTLLADHDLNIAKIAYAEADAAYQASRADVREAEEAFEQSQIKAPFDALVVASSINPGETVVVRCQAQDLLTIAAAGEMRVRFPVAGNELGSLAVGKAATVEVAGQRYNGKVTAIGLEPDGNKSDSSYPVTVIFPVETILRAGLSATVSVP